MKGLFSKIRISRKIVLAIGGVFVLCGATGAAAVFIGADKILGPSYAELNGLECTEVKTVNIKKKDRFWVRKYITTDKPGDGLTRVKTALRVAGAIYQAEKPDLVQVVVLDKSGPKDRADMRGRAVGADVVYIADPSRVPEEANGKVFTARYVDKAASAEGLFYGERIAMPQADIEQLVARLDDKTDCIKPEVVVPEGHGAVDAHGAPAGHGADAGHGDTGHGSDTGHGDTAGHGAEAPAEGHGAPAAEGHGDAEAETDGHGATKEKGWLGSITGLFGGGGEASEADGHGAVPAEGHGDNAGHAAEGADAPVVAHVSEAPAGENAAHTTDDTLGAAAVAEPVHPDGASQGWFSSLKGMVLGAGEEKPAAAGHEDEAAPGHETGPAKDQAHAAPEGHAAADGVPATAEDAATVERDAAEKATAAEEQHSSAQKAPTDGQNKASAAGAAWLAKLRAKPLEGAADDQATDQHGEQSAHEIPAEDSPILPSKVSDKATAEKHAEATH